MEEQLKMPCTQFAVLQGISFDFLHLRSRLNDLDDLNNLLKFIHRRNQRTGYRFGQSVFSIVEGRLGSRVQPDFRN